MKKFRSKIIGKLLGNGEMIKHPNVIIFSFRHQQSDYDWSNYCFNELKHVFQLAPPSLNKKTIITKSKASSPNIDFLYDIWYENGRKIIPLTFLESNITEETLAWWYQDCGHLKTKKNGNLEKVILSTAYWTNEERGLLQYILNLKFNLLFTIDGQDRLILYDQFQINYFLTLINPYMHPSMNRKMKRVTILKKVANRTTITLPNSIQLNKPTKQINDVIESISTPLSLTPVQAKQWNYDRLEINKSSSYQINLSKKNRIKLSRLQATTGLSLNEIVKTAFALYNVTDRSILTDFNDLSTTQQAITLASILGDGSLRKRQTIAFSTSYYENSSENQRSYRQWKVEKLKPYFYFQGKSPAIVSRNSSIWMSLEKIFYANRIKKIPLDFLQGINDPHFLLTLYLDDGSLMISHKVNHRKKYIYLTPHIALYLQCFYRSELLSFKDWLNTTFHLQLTLARRPDGQGFYIRTTNVQATLDFLKVFEKIAPSYPEGSYKTNWLYRWHIEKTKWRQLYPTYNILLSSRERMKPYSNEEIDTLLKMRENNYTNQQIADMLGRTYWSIVYKLRDLRNKQ
ncbi:MAG TPA: hypothetical protein VK120_00015 [Sporosarcina sp.]|nr:hypothetical protein [Sporosarcina sp.]